MIYIIYKKKIIIIVFLILQIKHFIRLFEIYHQ
jgi:hypothetical protein